MSLEAHFLPTFGAYPDGDGFLLVATQRFCGVHAPVAQPEQIVFGFQWHLKQSIIKLLRIKYNKIVYFYYVNKRSFNGSCI